MKVKQLRHTASEIDESIEKTVLAILTEKQNLTESQQSQARANINAKKGGYSRIEKIRDYVHEVWYDGVDYGFSDLLPHTPLGACTSIRKGKFFARNLDWQYSECCEFFVHTPAVNGRHAVDGFGGNIPALTKSVVESGAWNAAYNWLPLSIADGHNDAGLCASMNVVPTKTAPNTYERTTGTNPTKPTLNGLMIVRYILDNHTDALEAAEDIRDNWNVVMPHTDTFDEELHFLIADATKTIVLEFVGNEAKIIEKENQEGYITNFRLNGVDETSILTMIDTIEPFGQGFERYINISENITTPDSITEAIGFISQLWYTHAYNDNDDYDWLTEFAGLSDELTVQATVTPSVYVATLAAAHQAYLDRTRDGQTWQTTHSVVYDIESGECLFLVQQDSSTLTQRDMATSGGGLPTYIAGAQTYMFASIDLAEGVNRPTTKDLYIKCPKGAILSTDKLRFYRQIKSKNRLKYEDGLRYTQKIQKGWITPMGKSDIETALRNVRLHFEKYEEGYDYWRVVPGVASYESLADVFADTYPRVSGEFFGSDKLRLYGVKCAIAVFREGTQITDYMTFSFGGKVYLVSSEPGVSWHNINYAQMIYK